MPLLVLWQIIYFLFGLFRDEGAPAQAAAPAPTGGSWPPRLPDEERAIPVEWELLPAIDNTAERD